MVRGKLSKEQESKFKRCVKEVSKQRGVNPFAICKASILKKQVGGNKMAGVRRVVARRTRVVGRRLTRTTRRRIVRRKVRRLVSRRPVRRIVRVRRVRRRA